MVYKSISVVVPVFNEEKRIENAIEKIVASDTCGLVKEIIVVDDGSTDNTSHNVKLQITNYKSNSKFKLQKVKILFIEKKKNEGKGAALKEAFSKSTGDIVLIQDADLEYDPSDYPILLEPFLKNDADVVYGSRFISDRPHRVLYYWHSVINKFLTMFSNMMTNLNLTDMETGFKVFKGGLIRSLAIKLESKRFGFEPEITARVAKIKEVKIYEVGISYSGRTYQEGKKIGWRDGVKAVGEIVYYNLFVR
ncbi:glycosyl transferase [Candidatus Roizmanbacteria bacterium CG_4_10_14_0_8_um_filter_39_9]|uniref:Glycosyl transferase n=1 Tax=Candidatus Roizmanbacteria bacterium CG_4_10_14_0_8_um_filter_39_9 TaxID=1974829 RepID=A0A2M7QDF5_9BACT|nr:MAG: glycosyl transferase [Candidatus Roizmanbacteria bacterium CG_4_10_14_0_8_um_filter_39_9]